MIYIKLFISESDLVNTDCFSKFNICTDINSCDVVLILPGGLGCMYDLFLGIKLGKKVILYNKDLIYKSLIKNLFELYEEGIISDIPASYISIESDLNNIIKILEEM